MKKTLALYTDIFDTQWTDKELLKKAIIAFLGSFLGTIALFIWTLFAYNGFNVSGTYIFIFWLSDNVSAFLLFWMAFLQMAGWIAVIQLQHRISFGKWFGFKNDNLPLWKVAFYGAILAGVLYLAPYAIVWMLDKFGVPDSEKVQTEFLVYSYPIFAMIFFPAIGMMEEVFFRGVLQNLFAKSKKVSVLVAILASSSIFTILHAFQYGLKVLLVVFWLSLILGFSYAKFKSLRLNMFAHYLNNLVAVCLLVLSSWSLATSASASDTVKAMSTTNGPEYNIFIKSFVLISKEDPLLMKYNAYMVRSKYCGKYDKVFDDDITEDSSFKDKFILIDRSAMSLDDKDNEKKKIKFDYMLSVKSKYIDKCNFNGMQKEFQDDLKELKKYDKWSGSVAETSYKYLADQMGLRIGE